MDTSKSQIILQRMLFRRSLSYPDGYVPIFPNRRHQNRKDGFGCSSLFPMAMPDTHSLKIKVGKQIWEATCLENFWQGAKVFDKDIDEKEELTEDYYKMRNSVWSSETPCRHKYDPKKSKCLYFPWCDEDGKKIKLDYIEAGEIYCRIYEKFALKTADYKKVRISQREEDNDMRI